MFIKTDVIIIILIYIFFQLSVTGDRAVCRHFAAGGCRRGNTCSFLHPGVNGPPV